MNKFFTILTALFIFSCSANNQESTAIPSWYLTPKQNDSAYFYGVAEGHSLEESTRFALADAAARLMVSISSTSTLIREENQNSTNEEMRQNVRQNIEKIDFTNFEVTNTANIAKTFYAAVRIEREPFLRDQTERLQVIETKLSNLEKNSASKNPIQKRSDLIKSLALGKELELRARILSGAGVDINLSDKLNRIARIENEMNKNLDKIEFFFEISSPKEISKIIRTALNNEKIAVAQNRDSSNPNQILIKISSSSKSEKIYESFITKIAVDFENSLEGKSLASNDVEVSGSSVISKEQSYNSALKSLEEKIAKDGILKTIGILN